MQALPLIVNAALRWRFFPAVFVACQERLGKRGEQRNGSRAPHAVRLSCRSALARHRTGIARAVTHTDNHHFVVLNFVKNEIGIGGGHDAP